MFSKSQTGFSNEIMSRNMPFSSQTLPSLTNSNYGTYGQAMIPNQQTTYSFDPRNLEIKTKSVEQTLLPLVTQISALVNFKESIVTGGRPKSERALRAALKIGSAVEIAVERFVVVGESIADENPEIQPEMYNACEEARIAGLLIL